MKIKKNIEYANHAAAVIPFGDPQRRRLRGPLLLISILRKKKQSDKHFLAQNFLQQNYALRS